MCTTVLQQLRWMDLTMLCHYRLVMLILALTLNGQVTRGIFGGHEAVPHSRPYMALLEMHMKDGKTKHCGGFLLNEDFVMTAAHCRADSYTVYLGLHNYYKRGETQVIYVDSAFPHKDYDPKYEINDIMLLKLSSKAHFNKNVQPIVITDQDHGSLPKSCVVSGWGRSNKISKVMTPHLMEVDVTLAATELMDKEKLYCSKGESGPGPGDDGGPLVCEDGKAYGVVSLMVQKESDEQTLSCYTKIPENRGQINWITEPTSYICVTGVQ